MTPITLLLVILAITTLSIFLEKKISWLVNLNSSCMIIIIALLMSTINFIPNNHKIYDFFTADCLPIILCLLVLGLNLKDIVKVKKNILYLFVLGTFATYVGGVITSLILYREMGLDGVKLSCQMVGSFVGGLENAVAIKEILEIPNEKFISMFTMDNIITSAWMILTMLYAKKGDRKDDNDEEEIEYSAEKMVVEPSSFYVSISAAVGIYIFSDYLSTIIGIHKILCITAVGLIVAQIKGLREHFKVCYLVGTLLFAPFFFSIGAVGDFRSINNISPYLIVLPFVILFCHTIILFLASLPLKFTKLEKAIVSQSLIGGAGTAVALAQSKSWKQGVLIGMVLGLLGYAIGNYVGIACYHSSLYFINIFL